MEKIRRKIARSQHLLKRHEEISTSDVPTNVLYVGNGGVLNGVGADIVESAFCDIAQSVQIISPEGKPYCFAIFTNAQTAEEVREACQGSWLTLKGRKIQLFLSYIEQVPPRYTVELKVRDCPGGLQLIENFITTEEEQLLLDSLNWPDSDAGGRLKQRLVQHFGYEFLYSTSSVDADNPLTDRPIPAECTELFERFQRLGLWQGLPPDQLTVNLYTPGQGIPPHVDTHSAFVDEIVSLSLGSDVVMNLDDCRSATRHSLLLPRRSLLVLGGDSRYCWTHGIVGRKHDVVSGRDGATRLQLRETRVSFTFRRLRRAPCCCKYPNQCDSQNAREASGSNNPVVDGANCSSAAASVDVTSDSDVTSGAMKPRTEDEAALLERLHVHEVYDEIASNFSDTRHTPWPKVKDFISTLEPGSVMYDVGCGNGKYLGINPHVYKVGLDASAGLCEISSARGFQTTLADVLHLPLRTDYCDAVICIAVIHHLTTQSRREAAVEELLRVVRPGGQVLITVWAMEQKQRPAAGDYVKAGRTPAAAQVSSECIPLHVNRTEFQAQDVLVPWHLKSKAKTTDKAEVDDMSSGQQVKDRTFHRFYHVFCKGELDQLCASFPNVTILDSYYDRGNWGIVLRKEISLD